MIKKSRLIDIYALSRKKKVIQGVPPLTFKTNGNSIKNYRIYGNTVSGESVGDKTNNLFDENSNLNTNGTLGVETPEPLTYQYPGSTGGNRGTYFLPVQPNETYTVSFNTVGDRFGVVGFTEEINPENYNTTNRISTAIVLQPVIFDMSEMSKEYTFTIPNNTAMIGIYYALNLKPINMQIVKYSTALPYEPYGYRVSVKIEGKNLLQNTATTQTLGTDDTHPGITFTVNNDGSIIVNGSSGSTQIFKWEMNSVPTGTQIILSGCPSGGGNNKHRLDIRNSSIVALAADSGASATYTITGAEKYVLIRIPANYVCENLTFYPMIRRAEIADGTYEPYHVPTTTNIYLPEQIKKVGDEAEYIDYREQKQYFADGTSVDVGLSSVPTISGTNVLSVSTTVQPSKIAIKY